MDRVERSSSERRAHAGISRLALERRETTRRTRFDTCSLGRISRKTSRADRHVTHVLVEIQRSRGEFPLSRESRPADVAGMAGVRLFAVELDASEIRTRTRAGTTT